MMKAELINIKLDVKNNGQTSRKLVELLENRVKWWALLSALLNIRVIRQSQLELSYLTILLPSQLSSKTLRRE
jgi:hypothetical protein